MDERALDHLRKWLTSRTQWSDSQSDEAVKLVADNSQLDLPDLFVERLTSTHMAHSSPILPKHLFARLTNLLASLRSNKRPLETLERMRLAQRAFEPSQVAKFRVNEAINCVQAALTSDCLVDTHVGQLDCVLVEREEEPLDELLCRICARLLALCPVKVVTQAGHYHVCLLAAYLVDLLHDSGFEPDQVQLLVMEVQPSQQMSLFSTPQRPRRSQQHSGILKSKEELVEPRLAVCLEGADMLLACQSIVEGYLRELPQQPNLVVLVEESAYYQFLIYWQREAHRLQADLNNSRNSSYGNQFRSSQLQLQQEAVQVDLDCIDMSLASRMAGNCVNVIKFRSFDDFCRLINKLRRPPSHCQMWSSGPSLMTVRNLCLNPSKLHRCREFSLNHLPTSLAAHRLNRCQLQLYRDSLRVHMDTVYSYVAQHYAQHLEKLEKKQATTSSGRHKTLGERVQACLFAYFALINKFKSMKLAGSSVGESMARMKRFQRELMQTLEEQPGECRLEARLEPVGLAVLLVHDKSCVRSKAVLVDFIFKNLMLGNAVLLICPLQMLTSRFPQDLMKMFGLPFAMVELATANEPTAALELSHLDENGNENLTSAGTKSCLARARLTPGANISPLAESLGWPSAEAQFDEPQSKLVKCPKNVYALEFKHPCELTYDLVDTLVVALGSRQRLVFYPMEVGGQFHELASEN